MKTRSVMMLLLSLVVLSTATAGENQSLLLQKPDSLEMRIDGISIDQTGFNSYATGETLNWGAGLFVGAKTGTNYTINLELGYMLKTGKHPLSSLSRDYIGKRNSYRLGVSAGLQLFDDEPVYSNDSTFYRSCGYGSFLKFNFGSPVLLNFISFSWHLKGLYTIPGADSDHNITEPRMVYGYGNDIEFWLTENACASVGYTDERDSLFGENEDDPIYPSRIRIVFGFKTFF